MTHSFVCLVDEEFETQFANIFLTCPIPHSIAISVERIHGIHLLPNLKSFYLDSYRIDQTVFGLYIYCA